MVPLLQVLALVLPVPSRSCLVAWLRESPVAARAARAEALATRLAHGYRVQGTWYRAEALATRLARVRPDLATAPTPCSS